MLYFKGSRSLFPFILLFCTPVISKAGKYFDVTEVKTVTVADEKTVILYEMDFQKSRPSPILELFRKKRKENRRLTAALLAFPFPFGIVGLHRIYLGTAPSVPVVYIATLGGVFGIIPFIDCCVLLIDKDFEQYANNKKVFMWIR